MACKKRTNDDCDKANVHQKDAKVPKQESRARFCGGSLNLWLWDKAKEGSFNELMSLMDAEACNIEAVDVGVELWNHLKQDQVEKALRRIGALPKLRLLQFSLLDESGSKSAPLSIQVLKGVIAKASQLQILILKDVLLTGEWNGMAEVLQSHPSLCHIRLENHSFADEKVGLDDVIPAFASMQTLRILEIHCEPRPQSFKEDEAEKPATTHQPNLNKLCSSTLKSLFLTSKSLEVVRLCGLPITDQHVVEMSQTLCACNTLRELLLWQTQITDQAAHELGSKVLAVHPSLAIVNLNDNDLLGPRGCQSIFEALATTPKSSIQELYVGCRDMDEACRTALLNMISANASLRKLEICFTWPPKETVQTLALFEQNLQKALQRDPQALEYVRLYNDWNDDSGGAELCWGTVWEKEEDGENSEEEDC